jgi:uncharacterized metal-binding protein
VIVISSGKTHDNINALCCVAIASYSVATSNTLGLFTAAGFGLGTVFLSPDLDLGKSNPTNRLGLLKPFFAPYRKLCGHHRSIISHSPILSTFIRVVYCLLPIICYLAFTQQLALLEHLTSAWFISVYIGLELSTDVHLVLDWQYSLRKKIKHF